MMKQTPRRSWQRETKIAKRTIFTSLPSMKAKTTPTAASRLRTATLRAAGKRKAERASASDHRRSDTGPVPSSDVTPFGAKEQCLMRERRPQKSSGV